MRRRVIKWRKLGSSPESAGDLEIAARAPRSPRGRGCVVAAPSALHLLHPRPLERVTSDSRGA